MNRTFIVIGLWFIFYSVACLVGVFLTYWLHNFLSRKYLRPKYDWKFYDANKDMIKSKIQIAQTLLDEKKNPQNNKKPNK